VPFLLKNAVRNLPASYCMKVNKILFPKIFFVKSWCILWCGKYDNILEECAASVFKQAIKQADKMND
jgi:hypothetical protein